MLIIERSSKQYINQKLPRDNKMYWALGNLSSSIQLIKNRLYKYFCRRWIVHTEIRNYAEFITQLIETTITAHLIVIDPNSMCRK